MGLYKIQYSGLAYVEAGGVEEAEEKFRENDCEALYTFVDAVSPRERNEMEYDLKLCEYCKD